MRKQYYFIIIPTNVINYKLSVNVADELSELQLHIWKIPVMDLSTKTNYSDLRFSRFSPVPPGIGQDSTSN